MNKANLKKQIHKELGCFLNEHGFTKKKEGTYLKISNDIICNICFSFGSIGFTCAVAMQPLYVPDHSPILHLTFGKRLSRFKVLQREWWPYDEPTRGIAEIKALLIKNGLPWFEKYCSPEGFIEFFVTGKVAEYGLFTDEYYQKQFVGFSLIRLGHLEEGITVIQSMLSEITERSAEWMHGYKARITELIDTIQNNPDKVDDIVADIIQENRVALKL